MKLVALMLALSSVASWGTGTRWITVNLPTHVLYVDEGSSEGTTKVPCVTSASASFERVINLMNSPYIPHHISWNIPADANLISLYGITLSGALDVNTDPKNPKLTIVIDCMKSVRPKEYPYSVDEVIEKVKACVKLNLNPDMIKVRPKREDEGEQGSADQPATALESKSEGDSKPKTESEVRPQ